MEGGALSPPYCPSGADSAAPSRKAGYSEWGEESNGTLRRSPGVECHAGFFAALPMNTLAIGGAVSQPPETRRPTAFRRLGNRRSRGRFIAVFQTIRVAIATGLRMSASS